MSLKVLTDMNFEAPDRQVMYCKVPNIVFVLFKSEACHFCTELVPMFNTLAQKDMRLTWAIADIGKYRNIVQMALNSTTPIKGVPMMILYVNGKPHANYKGARNIQGIMKFINEMLNQIQIPQQPQFTQAPPPTARRAPQQQPSRPPSSNIPLPIQDNGPESFFIPHNKVPYNEPYRAYTQIMK